MTSTASLIATPKVKPQNLPKGDLAVSEATSEFKLSIASKPLHSITSESKKELTRLSKSIYEESKYSEIEDSSSEEFSKFLTRSSHMTHNSKMEKVVEELKKYTPEVDILLLMDCTSSMMGWIKEA